MQCYPWAHAHHFCLGTVSLATNAPIKYNGKLEESIATGRVDQLIDTSMGTKASGICKMPKYGLCFHFRS